MSRNDRILAYALLGALLAVVAVALGPAFLTLISASSARGSGNQSDLIGTSAAVVTAFGTVVLGLFTIILARATKRLADVGEQPSVVVTIEPNRHSLMLLDLHVENTGTATAYDIEVGFDPPIEIVGRNAARPVPIQKISALKPRQSIASGLSTWDELKTKSFTVRTTWQRTPTSNKRDELTYSLDLHHLESVMKWGNDPAIEMADAVMEIAKTFKYLGNGFNRLSVNVFTAKNREQEELELERRFAERREANPSTYPSASEDKAASEPST